MVPYFHILHFLYYHSGRRSISFTHACSTPHQCCQCIVFKWKYSNERTIQTAQKSVPNTSKLTITCRTSFVVFRLQFQRQSFASYGQRRAVTTTRAIATTFGRRVCRWSRRLHPTVERTHLSVNSCPIPTTAIWTRLHHHHHHHHHRDICNAPITVKKRTQALHMLH